MQYDVVMNIGDAAWLQPPHWYKRLLEALLRGDKQVLKLLGYNPFPEDPPTFLRTVIVDYSFAPTNSSQWWIEKEIVVPPSYCRGPSGWTPPAIKVAKPKPDTPDQPFVQYRFTVHS